MIAYYFRVIDDDGKPTGWYGTVFAQNRYQLFWVIDEFTDPHSVEIKVAKYGGYCFHVETIKDPEGYDDYEISNPEFNDYEVMFENNR